MANALMRTLPAGLRVRVQKKEQEAFILNRTVNGRQVVHMLYEWFKTNAHMSTYFSFADVAVDGR